jgi:hypothetical protein
MKHLKTINNTLIYKPKKNKINAKIISLFSLKMIILSEPLVLNIKLSYLRDASTRRLEAGDLKSPIP